MDMWFILYVKLGSNSFDKQSYCHCLTVKFHQRKFKKKTTVQPYCYCGLTFCKQMFLGAEEFDYSGIPKTIQGLSSQKFVSEE